jgi:glycosyltransferase involved in cell wall biosynthesis
MKFIVFAEDWGRHPSSTQHIFKLIAKQHYVMWFNSVGMRKPSFNWVDVKRLFNKFLLMFTKQQSSDIPTTQPVNIQNPFILPWHDNTLVNRFNKHQVMKYTKGLSDDSIIYWVSVPTAVDMIHVRPQDTLIYYCGDDFESLAGVDHTMIKHCEERLIHKADYIFVASQKLLKKMPTHKTQVLEHGVDYDLFTQCTFRHQIMKKLNNVIGFYGSISTWLDYELLLKIATERPNYQLLLIGKAHVNIDQLIALDNVMHICEVKHSELIHFSQHWQISILPFCDNGQIRACNPLKLKEYLAVGKPIVSTRFPAVESYKDIVFVADDHDGFLARLDYAMYVSQNALFDWQHGSRDCVKKHSWQHKAQYVLEQLGMS